MNKDAIKHSFLLENEKQELLNKYNSLIWGEKWNT
jgi:hypothetical protein